jgi:hypothetical protein
MILWNTRKIEIDNKTITGFLETGRGAKYIYNNDLSTDLLNKENTVIVFELDDSNLVMLQKLKDNELEKDREVKDVK